MPPKKVEGLEGIVVANTRLGRVDGKNGKLYYSGYDIEDVARHASYEEVVYLLWNNRLPTHDELEWFREEIRALMPVDGGLLAMLRSLPKSGHPVDALRSGISYLGMIDPYLELHYVENNRRRAQEIAAKMPTIIAAWDRIRNGEEPVAPREDLGIAANFLYMLKGEEPSETAVDVLDTYLVLLAEHGMNASTFSARVTTSTDSDMFSAVCTAIGTLKGAKHGGASEAAMKMFEEIDAFGDPVKWFRKAVDERRRIMGIGHRVYRVEDPRATIFRRYARQLAESTGLMKWFEIAQTIDQLAQNEWYFVERGLYVNVDFYSSIVLYMLGIPTDMFTAMFAMSRAAGWTAHVIEQWSDNRLMRPLDEFVGELDLEWVPLDERQPASMG
jgi:citrate synthase